MSWAVLRDGGTVFMVRVGGVASSGDWVLLHRAAGEDFWALPGGRIQVGETAAEIGAEVEVGRLLWVIENFFSHTPLDQHDREAARLAHHEVGLYLEMAPTSACCWTSRAWKRGPVGAATWTATAPSTPKPLAEGTDTATRHPAGTNTTLGDRPGPSRRHRATKRACRGHRHRNPTPSRASPSKHSGGKPVQHDPGRPARAVPPTPGNQTGLPRAPTPQPDTERGQAQAAQPARPDTLPAWRRSACRGSWGNGWTGSRCPARAS